MRSGRARRIRLAVLLLVGAVPAFLLLRPFTFHAGETVILLMPPLFAAHLWWGWSRVRRASRFKLLLYVGILTAVVTGAESLAAHFVGGRVIPWEVAYGLYFIVAWRFAWEVWKRTAGSLGESRRRWARRNRRKNNAGSSARTQTPYWIMLIPPFRVALTVMLFSPLVIGSLIHRVKIGNPKDFSEFKSLGLESVSFQTSDGLKLSGWFLPEARSNATVIICHGAGANKANFIGFLTLFYGQRLNSLIFDFRGHGDSDGHTTTFGLFESRDVTAAVDWLKKNRAKEAQHVFALGSSMGAMALVRAAADDPRIEAIVLDSCFISASDFVRRGLRKIPLIGELIHPFVMAGVSLNVGQSMWNLDACKAIARISPRPVFLIHGDQDRMIDPANMDELYDWARPPKQKWLGPGPHSNVLTTDYEQYQRRVIGFFKAAHKGHAPPSQPSN